MFGVTRIGLPFTILFYLACTTTYQDRRSQSPNFVDGAFKHSMPESKGLWEVLKIRFGDGWSDWPDWVESSFGPKPKNRVTGDKVVITHVNHSTFLIQTAGYNILTDPIYSERCSPVSFAGPKRVIAPGIKFDDLPKIDLIIISHDHYDHLDLPTIEKLIERDSPRIFTGLGVGRHLPSDAKFLELDWWEKAELSSEFRLHFVPVQHFSGRGLFDRFETLWGAYVLEASGKKIYFGGDSGYGPHYKETSRRLGGMDISLIPVGAYRPRYFMKYAHMDPAEAVQAHLDLQSNLSIGMHFGTFQLTAEPYEEPVELLGKELKEANVSPQNFVTLKFGQPLIL